MRALGVRNGVVIVAVSALLPLGASAQDVVITLEDSNMELRGEILSFDGESLTLASTIGTVSFPLSEITCEGVACPVIASDAPGEYGVVLDPSLPTDMLMDLVTSFAASAGLSASPVDADGIEVATAGGDAETFRLFSTSGTAVGAAAELSLVAGIGNAGGDATAARLIGRGALVILADESLELNAMSLEQLAAIFSGQVSDWRELRRRAGPVVAHLREGDVADFEAVVLAPRGLTLGSNVRIVSNDTDMDGLLDETPGAVAMTGLAANRATRVVGIAESCGLNHEATPFEVASGEYPLVQHLRAERASAGDGLHPLFDHALTPEGQEIVTRYGYAGIAAEAAEADRSRDWLGNALKFAELASLTGGADQSEEVGELAERLSEATRLSPTFRYAFASQVPDAVAMASFASLAGALGSGRYDGYEVVFAGFTGDATAQAQAQAVTDAAAQRTLDRFRAEAPAVAARPGLSFVAAGFGTLAPRACAETAFGDYLNARVEVWVRPTS
ncbi:MAG: hypothetical protein AAFP17_04135 [Pseudomonadota bacterium]